MNTEEIQRLAQLTVCSWKIKKEQSYSFYVNFNPSNDLISDDSINNNLTTT